MIILMNSAKLNIIYEEYELVIFDEHHQLGYSYTLKLLLGVFEWNKISSYFLLGLHYL